MYDILTILAQLAQLMISDLRRSLYNTHYVDYMYVQCRKFLMSSGLGHGACCVQPNFESNMGWIGSTICWVGLKLSAENELICP